MPDTTRSRINKMREAKHILMHIYQETRENEKGTRRKNGSNQTGKSSLP